MFVSFLFYVICFTSVSTQNISIDLSSFHPNENNSVFINFYTLSNDKVQIDIENINLDVGFLVIQVHSFMENVTLSDDSLQLPHDYVTGTNIGLVWGNKDDNATFYIIRNILFESTVTVMLAISVYGEDDPVPGGCNLTFDTPIAPYQKVTLTDDYIMVQNQPPSAYGVSCDNNKIQVDMYHMFLPEYDNDNETYFQGIKQMMTVDCIKKNGKKVRELEGYFKYGRLYSNYRATGEVFAVIATYNSKSAAYIPAVSYGCDKQFWDRQCIGPVSDHWKFMCATLLIFGIFVTFFGHRFFKLTLFLMGLTFGIFLTYLVISWQNQFSVVERAVTAIIIGVLYGLWWTFIWWKFGIPLLSVHITFILSGIIVASTVFYGGLADLYIYTNDINFWVTFMCIVLLCLLLWTPATKYGHIMACSLVGAYASVTALNYYVGGNLQYIIINTFRRATVTNFRIAVIDPPFQTVDFYHALLWGLLVLFGCTIQYWDQRNKPPFPPNRNRMGSINAVDSERTPLLYSSSLPHPEYA